MITKERLEVLLEEDKVFYWVFNKEISMLHKLSMPTFWKKNWELYGKDCFETKEDAEEYAKFGNITRTEKLVLPSWEDVKDVGYDEIFFVKDNRFDSGVVQYYFLVAEQTNTIEIMFREIDHIMTITAYDVIFKKPLTRENYNEARRLCVKLFKGETNG